MEIQNEDIKQSVIIADEEKRITLSNFRIELKNEVARMFGRKTNVRIWFLAPKDYFLELTHKQALSLLLQLEHGAKGSFLCQNYDDNNEGIYIRKDYYNGKTKKTVYTIHG